MRRDVVPDELLEQQPVRLGSGMHRRYMSDVCERSIGLWQWVLLPSVRPQPLRELYKVLHGDQYAVLRGRGMRAMYDILRLSRWLLELHL
jgi:hypothetical protein